MAVDVIASRSPGRRSGGLPGDLEALRICCSLSTSAEARVLNGSAAAISAPAASTATPTQIAGRQPVDVGLRRGVAAVAGEHRREHRDAEHAAELADRVGGAGGLAGLVGP